MIARAKKEPIINLSLFVQLEAQGKEIKVIRNKKQIIVAANVENPLKKLRNKEIINSDQYSAGVRYSQDYELANISHHTKPSYDGLAVNGGPAKKNLGPSQAQLSASKIIHEIRALLCQRDIEFQNLRERSRRLRCVAAKNRAGKKYLLVTKCVLEKELSLTTTSILCGIRRGEGLEARIIEVLNIVDEYYKNLLQKNAQKLV